MLRACWSDFHGCDPPNRWRNDSVAARLSESSRSTFGITGTAAVRRVRVDGRVGLSVLEQLIKRDTDVFGNLTKQDWGDVPTLMKRNRCAAACGIAKLFV